jgi:hypothetical protein
MPTNHRLENGLSANAGETRALLVRWGRLHAVRSALGGLTILVYLLALSTG